MELSEFVLTRTKGSSALDLEYFAEVTVTTGMLWWKRKVRRVIRREYVGLWYFVDTGEFCPGFAAQQLERAYKASKRKGFDHE